MKRFAVEGIVARGISEQAAAGPRRDLLGQLNTLEHVMKGNARLTAFEEAEKQAYDLILGDAGKVFDLSKEREETRDRYGRNMLGQSCPGCAQAAAVERGVPYVTINAQGWDSHRRAFSGMRQKLPEMDRGVATYLRGVWPTASCSTEHHCLVGRRIRKAPRASPGNRPGTADAIMAARSYSVIVAGGGFKAAAWSGRRMKKGRKVKERPVYPCRTSSPACMNCSASTPTAKLTPSPGAGCARNPHRGRRRQNGRTPERNHVTTMSQ